MLTPSDASSYYQGMMSEVKVRTDAIDRYLERIEALKGQQDSYTDAESCFLQLRYICELIALGSLAIHTPNAANRELLKTWNAEKIFRMLERQNSNCFPRAVILSNKEGAKVEFVKDAMGLEELKQLYSICGERLHVGTLHKMNHKDRRAYDPTQILNAVNRIKGLLSNHVIMLLELGEVWLVRMRNEANIVEVIRLKADGPAILVEE